MTEARDAYYTRTGKREWPCKSTNKQTPNSCHLHHIVPLSGGRADGQVARNVLATAGPPIGINSADNLVPLQRRFHERMHTNKYYKNVAKTLTAAQTGGHWRIIDALHSLRLRIMFRDKALIR